MICKNCGKEIENGHIMCPGCGTLIDFSYKSGNGIDWGTDENSGQFFESKDVYNPELKQLEKDLVSVLKQIYEKKKAEITQQERLEQKRLAQERIEREKLEQERIQQEIIDWNRQLKEKELQEQLAQYRQKRKQIDEKRKALQRLKQEREEAERIGYDKPTEYQKHSKNFATKLIYKWKCKYKAMSDWQKLFMYLKVASLIGMVILTYYAAKDKEYNSPEQAQKRWEMVDKSLEDYDMLEGIPEEQRDLFEGKMPEGLENYNEMFEGKTIEDYKDTINPEEP